MKICSLILVLFLLAGCATTSSLPHLTGYAAAATEKDKGNFIELNDGSIIEGDFENDNLSKLITIGNKRGVTINGKRYLFKEMKAIQRKDKYYRRDAYNSFDFRIVKGRINVYRSEHSGTDSKGNASSYDYNLHYLQKGDTEPVVAFEIKVLEKMVADYEPAVEALNNYKALSKKQKRFRGDNDLNNIIFMYNNR